jgi:hypothetical protein
VYFTSITRVIKSIRLKWTRHTAHIGNVRNIHKFFVKHLMERNHLGCMHVDGKTSSKEIRFDNMHWIQVAQDMDMDQRHSIMNTVTNL